MNTNQLGMVSVIEPTAGTYEAPQASDSDVIIWGNGQPTVTLNNESLGKLADGSFRDAPVAGGQQSLTLSDFSMEVRHSDVVDGTTAPKWWKYAQMAGAKVDSSNTQLAIVWDGTAGCSTGSANTRNLDCAGNGIEYSGRGMRGSMTITADGSNAPFIANVTGLTGALVAKTAISSQLPYVVTGNDTANPRELMANYTTTINGVVYQVSSFEFDAGFSATMEPANNASGIAQAKLTAQDMRLKMTLVQLTATDTIHEDAKANTVITDLALAGGGSAGYDMTFSLAEHLDPTIGDIDGTVGWDVELIVKKASFLQKNLT